LFDAELDGQQAEAKLAALWQKTFTLAAAAQEAWLEDAIVRRGRAIVEDIYPDAAALSIWLLALCRAAV
jgi:hypothetical protein